MTNPLAQDLGGVVLLPCPFCGAEMNISEGGLPWHPLNDGTRSFCIIGGMSIYTHHIGLWNTRANSAEIAGALRDAERYRWLKCNCQHMPDDLGIAGQLYFGTYAWGDLDTAIDSAMQHGGGG